MSIFDKIISFIKGKVFTEQEIKIDQADYLDLIDNTQDYIEQVCEGVIGEQKKQEELKLEYEIVTSYLTDIQKIDRMLPDDRDKVESLANDIYQLTKERTDFQGKAKKLTNAQYKVFVKNEDKIPGIIEKLKEDEEYYSIVKSNLDKLEGEKGALLYEKESIDNKQKYINWLAKVTFIWVIVIIGLLKFMEKTRDIEIQTPVLIIVGIATLFVLYMIVALYRNRRKNASLLPRLKRTIRLLNRAKIRFVNKKNALDYLCRKYKVHNSMELEYNWMKYLEEQEEERKYRQNTGMLDSYANELVELLARNKIKDPDIWIHQTLALIEEKEMVEVRHNLNSRRQAIRQEIEERDELIKTRLNELRDLLDKHPESRLEVSEYLKGSGLEI